MRRLKTWWCRTFHQRLWRGNSVCRTCLECGLWWTRTGEPAPVQADAGPYRTAALARPRCAHPYSCPNDGVHYIGGVWWCEGCAHQVFTTGENRGVA